MKKFNNTLSILKNYKTKRNFSKTPEPLPISQNQTNQEKKVFVVQKHNASHLHYDFRIENDGVLLSWAVPKGPPLKPKIKRLAIQTEDHPLEYAKFHGIIPEGNYGAGTVEIWDSGTYTNLKPYTIDQSLKNGELLLDIEGEKLKGKYALIKTNYISNHKKNNWLFIKLKK